MTNKIAKEILAFLASQNGGEYRSRDLLFAKFIETNSHYLSNQRVVLAAMDECFANGWIEYEENPSYFIRITEMGRKQIRGEINV